MAKVEVLLTEVLDTINTMEQDPDPAVKAVAKLATPACAALQADGVQTIEVEDDEFEADEELQEIEDELDDEDDDLEDEEDDEDSDETD